MVSRTYQGPCYSLWDGMPLFSPMWPQCWPSTIEQGWLTPDHYLTSFKIFIRMACTGLHVESFSTLSPWFICSDFHLPSYKNLCLHWDKKWWEDKSPPSSQATGTWTNLFPFSLAPVSRVWLSWWQAVKPWFGYIRSLEVDSTFS